ncbi:MAG: hypothetical protein ACKJSG_18635, partial [Lentisphaeria bacterium]
GNPVDRTRVLSEVQPGDSIVKALESEIDIAVVALQARLEGLDANLSYRYKKLSIERSGIQALVLKHKAQLPEIIAAKAQPITEADIDQHLQMYPERFEEVEADQKRTLARRVMRPQRIEAAYDTWLKAKIKKTRYTVNGEAIPAAVIDQAISTLDATAPQSVPRGPAGFQGLATSVFEMVLKQNGHSFDNPPATPAAWTMLRKSVVAADDVETKLMELPEFQMIFGARQRTIAHATLLRQMTYSMIAAMARDLGIDKTDEYVNDRPRFIESAIDQTLADIYFEHHDLGPGNISTMPVFEQKSYLLALVRSMRTTGEEDSFRAFLASRKILYTEVPVTDAELESWDHALTLLLMGVDTAITAQLRQTHLMWKLQDHVAKLRAKVDIKYLIEPEELQKADERFAQLIQKKLQEIQGLSQE